MKTSLYDFYNATSTGLHLIALVLWFFLVCLILASLLRPAISGTVMIMVNLAGCIWMGIKRAWA